VPAVPELPCSALELRTLLEAADAAVDAAEDTRQGVAELRHNNDQQEADTGGQEAVFNGGRTGLVLHKTHKLVHLFLQFDSLNSTGPRQDAFCMAVFVNRG